MANHEGKPPPFGVLLLRLRTAAGLTQEQLAARAGLSPQAVAALERGRRRAPRAVTVDLLAAALGLDANARTQLILVARGVDRTEGTAAPKPRDSKSSPLADTMPGPGGRVRWSVHEPTPLIDRIHELDTIVRSLAVEGARLLTLTGPAGVGKTRLAVAAAAHLSGDTDRFPDGIAMVDLTPVRDPSRVLGTIGRSLGFFDTGNRPLLDRLREAFEGGKQFLVLDNFEQLLPAAAAQLADLLAACPGLTLLVTSRVPLQLRWERELRIPPLPVPDLAVPLPPLDELEAIPSVALFVERARARQPDFVLTEQQAPVAARLVAQLDGLPLALELAAARTATLTLPVIANRLGDRLRLLRWEASDLPERQQSLEAAVGWSYDLLSADEQRVFRCLGVFVGRVSLDAIVAVVGAVETVGGDVAHRVVRETQEEGEVAADERTLPQLLSLAEKSLLLPLPAGPAAHDGQTKEEEQDEQEGEDLEPTFGMLETVREYAQERLAVAGELASAQHNHAHFFMVFAERADPLLRGHHQRAWYLRLERELDNMRTALRWLLDRQEPAERESALRLAGALGWFWAMRGYHAEGRRWLEEAFARAPDADPAVRTRALVAAGPVLMLQGEFVRARTVLREGLALAERRRDITDIARAHTYLALCAVLSGELAEGTRQLQEVLRRWEAVSDPFGLGFTHFYLGYAADSSGDMAAAAAYYTHALQWMDAVGDAQFAGVVHCYLGVAEWQRGELSRGAAQVRAAVRTSVTLKNRHLLSFAAQTAVALVGARADPAGRACLLGAADALARATGATFVWDRMPGKQAVERLRERIEPEGLGGAYRQGRTLPFHDVVALALRLLEEVDAASSGPEIAR